jgi:ABC-type uncharacterized transport system substrate-binding protein
MLQKVYSGGNWLNRIVMKKYYLCIKVALIAFRAIVYCVISDVFLFQLQEAQAHPHVFIVQRLNVVFDDKGLAGIKVRWKFDDMFASMIAEDHDLNHNGKLEPLEIKDIRENAFANISEYDYFSFIKIENKPFEVKFIKDFNAILENKGLVYEFFIPCHVTATNHTKKVSLAAYDPSYYSAIFFAEKEPVSLTSAEPYQVKTAIMEDPATKIYYDMVHPWTLFLEFRQKP